MVKKGKFRLGITVVYKGQLRVVLRMVTEGAV